MKLRSLFCIVTVILCLSLLSIGVYGADIIDSGACGHYLYWMLYDDGELVIEGTGDMYDYSHEYNYTFNDYVTTAPWNKHLNDVKKLTLTEGVTSIGYDAFRGCSGITGELVIPNSVTSIDTYAFRGCSGFTGDLVIPDRVTSIGTYAFRGCSGFTGDLVIGNKVTTIGNYAFYECSGFKGNLIIGNSVTSIGDYAFYHCSSIEKVTIYTKYANFGKDVFKNIHEDFTIYGYTNSTAHTYADENNYPFVLLDGREIVDSGRCGLDLYWTLHYDGELVIEGTGAMWNYDYDSTKYITTAPWGKYAAKLAKLTLTEGVTSIGEKAFHSCSGFTGELVIPDSVKTIGAGAFVACKGFTGNLVIPDSVKTIGAGAFSACSGFTGKFEIPDSVETIGATAFSTCTGFTGDLVIPDSVTEISQRAFYGCSGFTGDLVIPNSVTSIGKEAFERCSGFTGELVIGNSVTSIGEKAFYKCSGFTGKLVIPDSVETIGSLAFSACSGFTGDLIIPDSVTSIGDNAFSSCRGFNGKLIIPDSVTEIRPGTFMYCSGFTGDLIIPNSVTSIGDSAFDACGGFTGDLIIPDSVTKIGAGAFDNCIGFTGELLIPSSVTEIGDYAFYKCRGFTKAIIYAKKAIFGSKVFDETSSDLTIYGHSFFTAEKYANANGHTFVSLRKAIDAGTSNYVTWSLYADGELLIEGTGAMRDYISNSPWQNCVNIMTKLTLTEGITSIGNYAFRGCSGFTGDLVIPNSVTKIGKYAFRGCSGFTGDLVIPDRVTTIDSYAFYECSGFTKAIIYAKDATFGENVFKDMSADFEIHGYAGSTAETYASVYGYKFVEIGGNVKVNISVTLPVDFTVSERLVTIVNEVACRIGYISDGKYITVEAKANGNGGYDFDVPEEAAEAVLVVAGDISGDGVIGTEDKTSYMDAIMSDGADLTPEQFLAADINGDGEVDTADLVLIAKSQVDADHPFHKDIDW